MPQIATVGLAGGFRDDGRSGSQAEPAGFRRKTRALRVLRDSGLDLEFVPSSANFVLVRVGDGNLGQPTSAKGELFLKSSPRVSITPVSGQNINE